MAVYTNPYSGEDDSLDPNAARRRALLDMMGGPSRPTASEALPSSQGGGSASPYTAPAATGPAGATRATGANGADTPDAPDPTPSASTPSAATNPYATGDGRHFGNQILDLYDDPYTRRNT